MFKNVLLAQTADTESYYGLKQMGNGLGFASSNIADKDFLLNKIGQIISYFLSFLGLIVFLFIIYYGFQWMTAAGNKDKIEDIKKSLTALIVGFAIIVFAYVITNFIFSIVTTINQ